MPSLRKSDVTIIGLGNWGVSLAAALVRAGMPPREIVVLQRRRNSSLPAVAPSLRITTWTRASLDARILWLCVPDSAISDVASQIVRYRRDLRGQIVLHSSGALTVAALDAVRRAGARAASAHPAMTFPTRHVVPIDGVFFGVETTDPATRRTLHSLIRKLGGKPFTIASKDKALYHVAGTLTSPLLVSELSAAIETARLAGLDSRTALKWVEALAAATARNLFAHGPLRSFSGPFARGDASTIQLHLQALQEHPILAEVYRSLALYAVETLPVKNSAALLEALRISSAQK
jgi:predicted short-subunit dehydrogenase-like oxidoreductase (DUF2520 family)